MAIVFIWVACGVISYLLGAIPTGFVIAKARGIDITTAGSGNIGTTNVVRVLGKWWGLLTLVADVAKGYIAAYLLPIGAAAVTSCEGGVEMRLVCGSLAIAGHNWSVYIKFKGGKGVATSTGALLGLAPSALLVGFLVWCAIVVATKYVSLASIVGTTAICVTAWFLYAWDTGPVLPSVLSAMGVVLIWRHRSNIRRLIAGKENKIDLRRRVSEVARKKDADG